MDAAPKAGAAGHLTAGKAHVEGKNQEGCDKVAAAATAGGAVKGGRQGDTAGEKTEKEEEKPKEKPKKKYKVDEELLQAFRYFDRICKCPLPWSSCINSTMRPFYSLFCFANWSRDFMSTQGGGVP